jgi:hypothetical protein
LARREATTPLVAVVEQADDIELAQAAEPSLSS